MQVSSPLALHGIAATVAVAVVIALSQGAIRSAPQDFTAQLAGKNDVEMGIEHARPLIVALTVNTNGSSGIADLRHDSADPIYVSLPNDWTTREVKGSLGTVKSDPPVFGFTRWTIPANTPISFSVPHPPSSILMHNPSGIPLQVKLTRVDLTTQKTERDVILIKDVSVNLW
ncbi:MAG: hypothetical protein PHE68_04235 [Candidatus Peribacteraceae bacterium]|nr:hypothetical protein [Candidatus Peribacteraceae bacterium]MDD5074673.1 hypothetical protein [Candidatus Peribacteraceae bacterium]